MARVELTDDAKADIRHLDGSVKARVLKDLQKLKDCPSDRAHPLGSRKTGNLTGLRKLYVGPNKGYRAVFAAQGDEVAIVMVVATRSDSECYALALKRVQLLTDTDRKSEVAKILMSIMTR